MAFGIYPYITAADKVLFEITKNLKIMTAGERVRIKLIVLSSFSFDGFIITPE